MNEKKEKTKKEKKKKSLFHRIVNFFLGILVSFLILILLILGFSQTHTFREFLREKIITTANSSLGAEFNLEKINGTIFTSLILENATLVSENDTIISLKKLSLETSPLQLLVKKIYIRNLILEEIDVNLLQDKNGIWNNEKIGKPDTANIVETKLDSINTDEPSEGFQFAVEIANLQINNLDFKRINYKNRNNKKPNRYLEPEHLVLNDLNLKASIAADIPNQEISLSLETLNFIPNLSEFTLENLSGDFMITHYFAQVENLNLVTAISDVNVSAYLDSVNLFSKIDLEDFKNYDMDVSVQTSPFNFNDLSTFIGGTEILNGAPMLDLKVNGNFGDFTIEQLVVDVFDSHFEIDGRVKRLNTPKNLFIDVSLNNVNATQSDADRVLPTTGIPVFEDLVLENSTIRFYGEPTNFNAKVQGEIGDGEIDINSILNLDADEMEYDIQFITENIDLYPIIQQRTVLNTFGTLRGVGVDPKVLTAVLDVTATESSFDKYSVDSIKIDATSDKKVMDIDIGARQDTSRYNVDGRIDFTSDSNPIYDLKGYLKNLNLFTFIEDSALISNLNFSFNATGEGLDIDSMDAKYEINLEPSVLNGEEIDDSKVILELQSDEDERSIILESEFIDFGIDGKFSLKDALSLVTYQSGTISEIVSRKLKESSTVFNQATDSSYTSEIAIDEISKKDISFNFDFKFKDFDIVALILDNDKLEIAGEGSGNVKNDSTNFKIFTKLNIDYFININNNELIYLSEIETDLNFSRNNNANTFENLFGALSVTGNRISAGTTLKNFASDIIFNQNALYYNVTSDVDTTLYFDTGGNIELSFDRQKLNIEDLLVISKGITWENTDDASIEIQSDSIIFNNFNLSTDNAKLHLNGFMASDENQEIDFNFSNIPGNIVSRYLLNTNKYNLKTDINGDVKLSGNRAQPVITGSVSANNVTYQSNNFGNLISGISYSNNNFIANAQFNSNVNGIDSTLLSLNIQVPFNISFKENNYALVENQDLSISINANNFNLKSFGDVLPFVFNQAGFFNADLDLKGRLDSIDYQGYAKLTDASFRLRNNNLDYSSNLSVNFNNSTAVLENFSIKNIGGAKYVGEMKTTGIVNFEGFGVDKASISIDGDLALLGKRSRVVTKNFYGDLFIGTNSPWIFNYDNRGHSNFKGSILVKNADLTYLAADAAKTSQGKFTYEFVVDSSKLDQEEIKYNRLIANQLNQETNKIKDSFSASDLDYEIEVVLEDDAKFVFLLSSVLSQKLTVEASGSVRYENIDGQVNTQGELVLQDGSKLDFFKTFNADGNIQFSTDIANPYLDVVATYTNQHKITQEDVAIKIRLQGFLDELGKSLLDTKDKVTVYIGQRNIQQNTPDLRYGESDAVAFILLGKFPVDNTLTSSDKSTLAGNFSYLSPATSLLGSVLTTFINSQIGDVVSDISITDDGKFSVSGKFQSIRYKIGGSNTVFQDFNSADIKVDYSLSLVNVRLERKDPIIKSTDVTRKILEFGVQFKIEF